MAMTDREKAFFIIGAANDPVQGMGLVKALELDFSREDMESMAKETTAVLKKALEREYRRVHNNNNISTTLEQIEKEAAKEAE